MAIRFKEVRAQRILTDEIVTSSGEPANTASHSISGTLAASGNFAINTNKFQVAAATGNTTVAGTLAVTGATTLTGNTGVTGTMTVTGATALNGGLTLDTDKFVVADTTGATTIKGTVTVGVDDTGHDVKFFGATAGKYMLWDESADTLDVVGNVRTLGGLAMTGVEAGGVTKLFTNAAGDALLATGTSVPANDTAGFAKGCLFIDTDVAKGTTGLYCNKGTATECTFTAVTQA